uniref:Uncharacterized protein n=1 Tax=Picea glauca TaxID=3330 RepID=A0A124GPB7_PICGL|nr:hypothetical protein ABT39_MTgene1289 [Picea glauca]QHR87239.1 hypothetical protein Q903MT_gene1248 [Picea sitchensis]
MMRQSHVRFSEKGVATYWSFLFTSHHPGYEAMGLPLTRLLL